MSFFKNLFRKEEVVEGISPFINVNFNEGGFRILAYHVRNKRRGYTNPDNHFYTEDTKSMSRLAAQWKFEEEEHVSRCGSDYVFYIYQNDKLVLRFIVCFLCGNLSVQNPKGKRLLLLKCNPTDIQNSLKRYFKPIENEYFTFKTREEGIKFWKKEQYKSNLFYTPDRLPNELFYNGFYYLWLKEGPPEEISHLQVLEILLNKIESLVGHTDFKIERGPGAGGQDFMYWGFVVSSNKDVYDIIEEKAPSLLSKNQSFELIQDVVKKDWTLFSEFYMELFYK